MFRSVRLDDSWDMPQDSPGGDHHIGILGGLDHFIDHHLGRARVIHHFRGIEIEEVGQSTTALSLVMLAPGHR